MTNADLVKAYGVNKAGDFSKVEPLSKEAADHEMGLMRLVTPYINKEREEWVKRNSVIQSELNKLKAESDVDKNLPHMFVEGNTDKLILEKAVNVFLPSLSGNVKLDCGGNDGYGSANAASDRAIAWHLNQKHERSTIKAVLLLDDDDSGKLKIIFINPLLDKSLLLKRCCGSLVICHKVWMQDFVCQLTWSFCIQVMYGKRLIIKVGWKIVT